MFPRHTKPRCGYSPRFGLVTCQENHLHRVVAHLIQATAQPAATVNSVKSAARKFYCEMAILALKDTVALVLQALDLATKLACASCRNTRLQFEICKPPTVK